MIRAKSRVQIAPSDQTDLKEDSRQVKMVERDENQQKLMLSDFSNQKGSDYEFQQLNAPKESKNQCLQDNTIKMSFYNNMIFSRRFFYIKRFIKIIKSHSTYYRFTQTRKRFLQIIDDYAFDYDVYFYKRIFQNEQPTRLQFIMKKMENWFVKRIHPLDQKSGAIILPSSYVNRIWNIIQFVSLLIYIIYLPVRLAFDSLYQNQDCFTAFEVLPNVIQIINMVLEFNIGFYKHGQIILDRWEICKNYLSKKFIFNLVLNTFWLISLHSGVSIWLKCFGLVHIFSLIQLTKELEQANSLRETYGNVFELLKLSGFIFLCAHLACCCWYALAVYEQGIGIANSWLTKDIQTYETDLDINEKLQGYIAGIYYCILTMTTIGYGDITPYTFRERIFALVFCVLSCFLFAFTMGSIGEILKQFSLKGEEFKQKMEMLNHYMKKRNLSTDLQVRVRKFYENQNVEQSENNEHGSKLIDNLTPELREDVQKDIYQHLFKNISFFQKNFSERLIQNIYRIVEEKQFQSDEKIFEEGQKSNKLYVIIKGQVQIVLQGRHTLKTLREGEVLGLSEFFSQQPYPFSAKASRNTQFAIIKYDDFIKLAAEHKQDQEIYCKIKDLILLNNSLNQIEGIACESCGQTDHIFQNCQMISLNQNYKKNAVEQNKRKQITRQEWVRRTQSYQALINKQLIEIRAFELTVEIDQEQKRKSILPNQAFAGKEISSKNSLGFELNDKKSFDQIEEDSNNLFDDLGVESSFENESEEENVIESLNNIQKEYSLENTINQQKNQNTLNVPSIVLNQYTKYSNKNEEVNKENISSNQKLNPQNLRKKQASLTFKQNKQQFISSPKGDSKHRQTILDNLKRQVNDELQQKYNIIVQKTVISAENDYKIKNEKEEIENYNFEMQFDQMSLFKFYLVHNNYDIVLNQFNQIVNKNQLYQQLIIKSQRKKYIKDQTLKRQKQRELAYKKVPTSQKYYLMKQRNSRFIKDQIQFFQKIEENFQQPIKE
ncbi:cation channel family protein (macronuclear) [Tetrahymena thermophila SB210]|uniref:Cation channel family protein n=1 Tax=Tetrahymena thermophila (strain SB210) TaxID=312017 RepID=Q23YG4_TETTS|nr:cation channel family protein [Tetrahymena thermophila SB210]EAS01569.2 cation channel family protein [Tetrahymena thermophila SB210]|eukprot:XP_001021814.2 cation channel family protein [Tetrahymena thermophila SB210]